MRERHREKSRDERAREIERDQETKRLRDRATESEGDAFRACSHQKVVFLKKELEKQLVKCGSSRASEYLRRAGGGSKSHPRQGPVPSA